MKICIKCFLALAVPFSAGAVDVPDVVPDSARTVAACTTETDDSGTFHLTHRGVGSLQLGRPFTDTSASGEGLYNKVVLSAFEDSYSETGKSYDYQLYMDDEWVAGFCLNRKGNPIDKIYFYSSRIAVPGGLRLGMPLREAVGKGLKVLASPDMLGESQCGIVLTMDMDYIHFDIAEELSQEHFTSSGWQRIQSEIDFEDYNSIELTPDDIAPEVRLSSLSIQR